MRVAALTMSYNEPVWLPVWARYYASQVGAEHCLVLDHGSDDGSAEGLAVPVRRLERSPLDEVWRATRVAAEVARLLRTYDAVIHTDVDELLVADPARHSGLVTAAAAMVAPVVTAIGFDLHHIPGEEAALDLARPIGAQRRWVRFASSMCKPALVRRAVTWSPGFHSCDAPMVTERLFLLHLRYADLGAGLARLRRTREQAFADPTASQHQRVPNDSFSGLMGAVAGLPRETGGLDPDRLPLSRWMDRVRASRAGREDELYKLDLGIAGDVLWELPAAWRSLLC